MASPLSLVTLESKIVTPTAWIVQGLLPQETCLVVGAPEKTGKSWFAFDLAVAIVSGQDMIQTFAVRKSGPVLFYSPESGWNARSQRLYGLCWARGLDPNKVLKNIPFISDHINLGSEESEARLRATVESVQPILLVLDPLIACYSGADENSSNDVQVVLNKIRSLTELSKGMSVIVAHHVSKNYGERSAFHGLRGSTALGAWSDGVIRINSDGRSNVRTLDVHHRDAVSPCPVSYTLESEPGGIDGVPAVRLEKCVAMREEKQK